jgi:regulator of cell morphogenesis and NO signaling
MISREAAVSELVAERPGRSRVFESLGIDYCCGGEEVVEKLERDEEPGSEVDLAGFGIGGLVEHIIGIHHEYLRSELPRLEALVEKVARVHGAAHPELSGMREEFLKLRKELEEHTREEEAEIFPAGVRLEEGRRSPEDAALGRWLDEAVREHIETGGRLRRIRVLTGGYEVPEDACNTYRAMLDGLAELERDTHYHVFKENSLLFPKMKVREREIGKN